MYNVSNLTKQPGEGAGQLEQSFPLVAMQSNLSHKLLENFNGDITFNLINY